MVAVVAYHQDRLTRRLAQLVAFVNLIKDAGIQVATVAGGGLDLSTGSGRMMAHILGSVAQAESEHTAERIRDQQWQAARQGHPLQAAVLRMPAGN